MGARTPQDVLAGGQGDPGRAGERPRHPARRMALRSTSAGWFFHLQTPNPDPTSRGAPGAERGSDQSTVPSPHPLSASGSRGV